MRQFRRSGGKGCGTALPEECQGARRCSRTVANDLSILLTHGTMNTLLERPIPSEGNTEHPHESTPSQDAPIAKNNQFVDIEFTPTTQTESNVCVRPAREVAHHVIGTENTNTVVDVGQDMDSRSSSGVGKCSPVQPQQHRIWDSTALLSREKTLSLSEADDSAASIIESPDKVDEDESILEDGEENGMSETSKRIGASDRDFHSSGEGRDLAAVADRSSIEKMMILISHVSTPKSDKERRSSSSSYPSTDGLKRRKYDSSTEGEMMLNLNDDSGDAKKRKQVDHCGYMGNFRDSSFGEAGARKKRKIDTTGGSSGMSSIAKNFDDLAEKVIVKGEGRGESCGGGGRVMSIGGGEGDLRVKKFNHSTTRVLMELLLTNQFLTVLMKAVEGRDRAFVLNALVSVLYKWGSLRMDKWPGLTVRLKRRGTNAYVEKVLEWQPWRQDWYNGNFDLRHINGPPPARCIAKMRKNEEYEVTYVLAGAITKVCPVSEYMLCLKQLNNMTEREHVTSNGATTLKRVILKPFERAKWDFLEKDVANLIFPTADSEQSAEDLRELKAHGLSMLTAHQLRQVHRIVAMVNRATGEIMTDVRFEIVEGGRTFVCPVEPTNIYSPPYVLVARVQNSRQFRERGKDRLENYVDLPAPVTYEDDGFYNTMCHCEQLQFLLQDTNLVRLIQVDNVFRGAVLEKLLATLDDTMPMSLRLRLPLPCQSLLPSTGMPEP